MARLTFDAAQEALYSGRITKKFVKDHLHEFNSITDPDGVPLIVRLCAQAGVQKADFLISCGVDIYKHDCEMSNVLYHMMRFWCRTDVANVIRLIKTTPMLHAANVWGETPALQFFMTIGTVNPDNKQKYLILHDAIVQNTNLHHIQNIYQNKFLCFLTQNNALLRHHLKLIQYQKKYFRNDFGWGKLSAWVRNSGNSTTKKIIANAIDKCID